ncbi:PilZ domain-containing protein [Yoonia algicola]|uniref:PilZ domain-containing protein n=1 Tax=Yoonia algicola TaxID=3137368 RepID=A0AAN0NIM2_9RHOB
MKYRAHRYPTQFPIKLSSLSGLIECQVIDVNSAGARITGAAMLTRGEKVTFHILNHKAEAIVRWVSGTRAGITFRPHLTELQVDMLRYRRDKANYLGHRAGGMLYPEMR